MCGTAGATFQIPDRIIFQGVEESLYVDLFFPSPLEVYFLDKADYPFRTLNTAQYRGHVATWEVAGDQLYLNSVGYHDSGTDCEKEIPLGMVFSSNVTSNRLPASWFTGLLMITGDNIFDPHAYLRVNAGKVVETCIVPTKSSDTSCSHMEKDYSAYMHSFPDFETRYRAPVDVLNPYTDTEADALDVLAGLPGYSKALSLFEIKTPRLQYQNCSVQGVSTDLTPINSDINMRITWENDLGENGYLYNWHHLIETHNSVTSLLTSGLHVDSFRVDYNGNSPRKLKIDLTPNQEFCNSIELSIPPTASYVDELKRVVGEYHRLATIVSKHVWLLEWRKTFPSYTLKLDEVVTEEDRQAWKLAGLKGEPTYSIWLQDFKVHNGFATFLIGLDDTRVLTGCLQIDHAPRSHLFAQIGSFCTVLNNNKYVVVEPSGRWHTHYTQTWRQWLHQVWSCISWPWSLFRGR